MSKFSRDAVPAKNTTFFGIFLNQGVEPTLVTPQVSLSDMKKVLNKLTKLREEKKKKRCQT
jgi:hypothetical protein